jgi:hypothetical protein
MYATTQQTARAYSTHTITTTKTHQGKRNGWDAQGKHNAFGLI